MTLGTFLTFLLASAFSATVVWGIIQLCKKKYGEWFLFVLFSLLLFTAGWFYIDCEFSAIESHRNMRAALIRCGKMIRSGEKAELHRKLAAFVASENMNLNVYPLGKAFRKAVHPEPLAGEGTAGLVLFGLVGNVFLIWGVLAAIWGILGYCKYDAKQRRLYLGTIAGISLLATVILGIGSVVRSSCIKNGFRCDVQCLLEETVRPELRPELLPLLEEPREEDFRFLRDLPPRAAANPANGVNQGERFK